MIPRPDARLLRDPDPERLRELLDSTGLTQAQAAARLGIGLRTLERYLSGQGGSVPYTVQYAIEAMARKEEPPRPKSHPFAHLLK